MQQFDSLKIYAVFHKDFVMPTAGYVQPIHAGKAIAKQPLPILGDDGGENISALNTHFCELTALYFVWKNKHYAPATYWGLCHYRRYFTLQLHWTRIKRKSIYYLPIAASSLEKIFSTRFEKYLQQTLTPNTIILPMPTQLKTKSQTVQTVRQAYVAEHDEQSWQQTMDIILERHPAYAAAIATVEQQTYLYACNMLIAHASFWDGYLTWLFDVLFALKKVHTISADPYQARIFGFLGERLLNIYVQHHRSSITIKELPFALLN